MAHFPRWVQSERVDSAAMLSAFLEYRRRQPEIMGQHPLDQLWIVNHYHPGMSNEDNGEGPVWLSKRCTSALPCKRCTLGHGGYMFRWFDARWEHTYRRLMCHGAWPSPPNAQWIGDLLNED